MNLELTEDELVNYTTDSQLSVEIFQVGQKVDVTGTTIGKGFQGANKRHHFRSKEQLTVYQYHIILMDQLDNVKIQVEYFQEKKWRGI